MAPVVYVVYYSMYGHVKKLADSVASGLQEAGVEVRLFQVPETLPEEVLQKMSAPAKPDDPIITAEQLVEADGVLFGIPTRFGMMASQMKSFLDSTGGLWLNGRLIGKPAGMFCSTGSQGGGQETTALTAITQLAHHGMLFVPLGYSNMKLADMSELHGGSPYGAGTFAGSDGSRNPSDLELELARHQGKMFGETTKALVVGRQAH
uniref:NAD(P)H dehydrogenase (quinone) n=1 Tax=Tetraselmis sp. GSL018 TaxID=582737 RepID=A0A061SPA8_9CHLO|mmetsp:Transcript_236/g.465  ORF Transcript_236/g.465 Transcript_236/m.465 type:complete len:206 (+) Transcript_236:69-686(+)|eukprot:CAMPEP_0177579080 /NCGR_PEP_ID=MMETSP0419_2-20121207/740_1 /TAXON_ID=582737 /ORGANISM="Tetraselmis sp., Strain GSL018" /LENGTH=205 /DNA_ID=CAMNT_0019067665 /DNA_START=29 /DNA_END=646 /DNA_ORIENTATION=-